MSRRSKRRHREQRQANQAPLQGQAAAALQGARGRGKGRTLLIGGAVVVVAAILYAVSGSGGRQGETAAGSVTNAAPLAAPGPTPALLATTGGVAAATDNPGPKIKFSTPVHDFGKIKGGEVVKYAYVFTNVGGATLQVSNVQASCGCTTAGEWTRQVEPGKTGSIPIQFNSGNFRGQVGKSITVTCNDRSQPTVMLQIQGNIWRPIDVSMQYAVLNVTAESPSNATTVRIVNNEETPLTLSAPESSHPIFAAELKTNQPGKQFDLVVRTVPPLPAGNVQGQITLRTSSTNLPVINLSAWLNMQPVIVATPSQISLPAPPLAVAMPWSVSIRNNGTNTLTLSEPVVNAKGVDVQLKEIEPGQAFALALNFPAGFEIAQGEKVELSVNSNHRLFPTIKVPIMQPARPAPPAMPAGVPAGAGAAGPSASK